MKKYFGKTKIYPRNEYPQEFLQQVREARDAYYKELAISLKNKDISDFGISELHWLAMTFLSSSDLRYDGSEETRQRYIKKLTKYFRNI